MRERPVAVTRRAFLGGAVLVGAAGCRHRSTAPPPDPDAARIASAVGTEREIVAGYAALAAAGGPKQEIYAHLRDLHTRHLTALGGSAATPTSTTPPSAASTPGALVDSSAVTLQAAAVTAVSGQRAAVLASIAASHLSQPPDATWLGS